MTDEATDPTSLADIAVRRARRDASTPFVLTLDEQNDHAVDVLTYGAVLDRAAALVAARWSTQAWRRAIGSVVTSRTPPSWVVASLAVWFAGGAVAAAGTLLPPVEAAALFALADAKVVVTTSDTAELDDDFTVLRIDDRGLLGDAPDPAANAWRDADLRLPELEDLAVAIFTSGTTGRPKGITHTHGDIVTAARGVAAGYARNSDYRPDPAPARLAPGALFNPFGHMAGYSRLAFRMWIGRPTLIVPKFTVDAARALLAQFDMDSLQLSPTMIHMLATAEEPLDLRGVKYVTSGTAPLSIVTRERFEARYGVPVMQAYGMTEVGAVSQERYDDVVAGRRGPGSVGRIAAGVDVHIRHLDDDRPAGEGEILVRTAEASKEFIGGAPVPVDADGWFATGDVGRIDDDILYITGRVQEKIIVGGFNVYPAEVEDVARRSPAVRDAVVLGLPDERLGEVPVAGIVWAQAPDEDALLEELRAKLAHYKVPRAFFALDAVPLTTRDKVDRRRAAEIARAALGRVERS